MNFASGLIRQLLVLMALVCCLASTLAYAGGGQAVALRKIYTGKINYIATGASFRSNPNNVNACSFNTTAPLTLTLPGTAGTIVDAFLYLAGSGTNLNGGGGTTLDMTNQNTLTLNGSPISATPGPNGLNFTNLWDLTGATGVDFFGAKRDVKNIVTGSGTYTLAGLQVDTTRLANQTCLGAWGLVVIFEDTAPSAPLKVINLFDGFREFQNNGPGGFVLEPRNFVISTSSPQGKMTHLSFEGDSSLPQPDPGNCPACPNPESFELAVPSTLQGGTYQAKTNGVNSATNQFNDTVSGPLISPSVTNSYGLDVDTYDISSQLSGNEYTAETRYISGQDLVLLMSEVVAVDNKALADIEVTLSTVGTFQKNTTNASQYVISVKNNGDGATDPLTGEATGFIHVYDDLPTGISIDNISDVTGSGWDCSNTNVTNDQIRCKYDLSTLGDGELDRNEVLPNITVTVDVATPTSPVTNRTHVSLCATTTDTCTTFAGKHTDANQFDPVEFFELPNTLFNVLTKSSVNNNVHSKTTVITDPPTGSNLSTSYKFVENITSNDVGNTQQGHTLRYTIQLVETGGVGAINVSVDDTIPTYTTFVAGTLKIDGVVQPDPAPNVALTGLTVPANGSKTITFDVTVNSVAVGSVITNTADITHPAGTQTSISASSQNVVVTGPPATGLKDIYLKNLNTSPIISRLRPSTINNADYVQIAQNGTISIDLGTNLAKALTLNPATGTIPLVLRMSSPNGRNTVAMTASLGHHNGGTVTNIGSETGVLRFNNTAVRTLTINLPINAITTIPAGSKLRLTLAPQATDQTRPVRVYSYVAAGRSSFGLQPTPVINVDSISFWTDKNGAGSQITNPDPVTNIDVYAKIVISDPFGDFDIQAPNAVTNPSSVAVIDPDNAAFLSGSTSCTAPCYAYEGEDTVNDVPGNATRTFYYRIRLKSSPPSTRGTWTTQVVAHEGLEGTVTHTAASSFTTLTQANLATSTKGFTNSGDVDPGDTLTYIITLYNTGGQAADNAVFSDTLQSSPVSLTFSSASTTCKDEVGSNLPNPSHSGGVVSLSNISVLSGANCTITINTTVGAGSPGDQINNTASITNPNGPGAQPTAATILLSESQIPTVGNKQLYLEGIGGGSNLTRTQPGSTSSATIASGGGTRTLTLNNVTTRAMTLNAATFPVKLLLRSTNIAQHSMAVDFQVNNGAGFVSVASSSQNVILSTGDTFKTFYPTIASNLTLNVGASMRLIVTNNSGNTVTLSQTSAAPYSQIVLPLSDSIDVTDVLFYDRSATDNTGNPGCETTFSCGTQVNPGTVVSGNTIWMRATIADGFGSFDVNTGSTNCTGGSGTNCPTIIVKDPNGADKTPASPADELTYVHAPDPSSRRYEFEVNPSGFGLEGIWEVTVTGKEGVENVISDTGVATFERYGQPLLTVIKRVDGTGNAGPYTFVLSDISDPGAIAIYENNVNNTGNGPATAVTLTNDLGPFLEFELLRAAGSWVSNSTLSSPYTINTETFDDGTNNFTYDPNVVGPCSALSPPDGTFCYDAAIKSFRVLLDQPIPVSGNVIQTYRARLDNN